MHDETVFALGADYLNLAFARRDSNLLLAPGTIGIAMDFPVVFESASCVSRKNPIFQIKEFFIFSASGRNIPGKQPKYGKNDHHQTHIIQKRKTGKPSHQFQNHAAHQKNQVELVRAVTTSHKFHPSIFPIIHIPLLNSRPYFTANPLFLQYREGQFQKLVVLTTNWQADKMVVDTTIRRKTMHHNDDHVMREISIIHRYGNAHLAKELKQAGIEPFPPVYFGMIHYHPAITQEQLASFLHLDKGAVAKTIGKMEQSGYIRREKNLEDQRKKHLFLTQKGEQVLPLLLKTKSDWEALIFSQVTSEEKELFQQLLSRICATLLSKEKEEKEETLCND